ncbi:EAL domain-containing protein [Oleidesulfovibrio sp.]|uniref:bifunctional diguanylate cyclase/phosphodiesterase n=1 Tax=Oleidesulfovibrio sp. TaxID=2909707 RepID=UPI003A863FE9
MFFSASHPAFAKRSLPRQTLLLIAAACAILSVVLSLSHHVAKQALQEHESLFLRQQSLMTSLASEAMTGHLASLANTLRVHSIPFELDSSETELESLSPQILRIFESYPSLTAVSYSNIATGAEGIVVRPGTSAAIRGQARVWGHQTLLHPPQSIRLQGHWYETVMVDNIPLAGMQLISEAEPGVFVVAVINMKKLSAHFAGELKIGESGSGYVLDQRGNILFDAEADVIGRNVFDGMHSGFPELQKIDSRMLSSVEGTGVYEFISRSNRQKVRKIVAWSRVPLEPYSIVISLSSPVHEINASLYDVSRLQGFLAGSAFLMLALFFLWFLREQSTKSLRRSEELYRQLADTAYDMEMWHNAEGQLVYVSPSCERITGYPVSEFSADRDLLEKIIHKDDLPVFKMHMGAQQMLEGESLEYRIITRFGKVRWVSMVGREVWTSDGIQQGVRSSVRDVTESKMMEKELDYKALHDELTGLANRALCLSRIREAMTRSIPREGVGYAVLFLDVDRFKIVNDSLGHEYGDKVLAVLAERLVTSVRHYDTVARFGGDEFVIVLEELDGPRRAVRIARSIKQVFKEPVRLEGEEVCVSCSIGMVFDYGAENGSAQSVVRNASIAMYRAKAQGRDKLKVFQQKMLAQAASVMALENDMRHALQRDEFFVEYQPVQRASDSSLTGFEALIRWNHPEKGLIRPDQFIPLAEESGLIIDIGMNVLRKSCFEMARWCRLYPGCDSLFLSVNLSARQFLQPDLVLAISAILNESGLLPHQLKLEITESTIMSNAETALGMMHRLKELGVQLAIDDFGTGYSSLAYLQKLPVDTLKVDRMFVCSMEDQAGCLEIVRSIIVLARSLNMSTIAEGVETYRQLEVLRNLGCSHVQGYYFHKPLPVGVAEALLSSNLVVPMAS